MSKQQKQQTRFDRRAYKKAREPGGPTPLIRYSPPSDTLVQTNQQIQNFEGLYARMLRRTGYELGGPTGQWVDTLSSLQGVRNQLLANNELQLGPADTTLQEYNDRAVRETFGGQG